MTVSAMFRTPLTTSEVPEFLKRLFKLTNAEYQKNTTSTEGDLIDKYEVRAYRLEETQHLKELGGRHLTFPDDDTE